MEFDEEGDGEEDFEPYGEEPKKPQRVKCKYCDHITELAEEIRLNPETGEYEYVCPNCARMFARS